MSSPSSTLWYSFISLYTIISTSFIASLFSLSSISHYPIILYLPLSHHPLFLYFSSSYIPLYPFILYPSVPPLPLAFLFLSVSILILAPESPHIRAWRHQAMALWRHTFVLFVFSLTGIRYRGCDFLPLCFYFLVILASCSFSPSSQSLLFVFSLAFIPFISKIMFTKRHIKHTKTLYLGK